MMHGTNIQIPAFIALSSPVAHPASAHTRSRHREDVSGSAMATIKLPLPSLSLLLLVLLLSAAWMPPKANAQPRTCSIELDPSGCRPVDCVARCARQYRGVGECAHREYVSDFHCVCLYACL